VNAPKHTLTWIEKHDPLYPGWVALRQRILREPLGLRTSEAELEVESNQLHLIAVPLSPESWKIRQVAIDPFFQGQGLGRQLMERAIGDAGEKGIAEIVLHSRSNVVGFYERLGFSPVGPEFEEVGIPHRKMVLTLSSA
jgi:predicted GNAT family N-acyltransferase